MNSLERVKAAIHFNSPEKVPIMNFGSVSDVFPLVSLIPKTWKPGHAEDEIGLFPYIDGPFEWDVPDWAQDPKYENWKKIPHEEIDEWGCIWNRDGKSETMGHLGRPSLSEWSNLDKYLERYTPDPEDKSKYSSIIEGTKYMKGKKYKKN